MSTALTQVTQQDVSITRTRMGVAELIEQRKAIVEVMEKSMKKDIDYGIIPGTPKPTLYKPGSEKILAIFHLGVRPRIEDLSTPDCIRYRVHLEIFHQPTGLVIGEGVGEASSAEAKYQWRAAVCDEEWDATPEDRKRDKWKKAATAPTAFGRFAPIWRTSPTPSSRWRRSGRRSMRYSQPLQPATSSRKTSRT
jgi:hypothetical protein